MDCFEFQPATGQTLHSSQSESYFYAIQIKTKTKTKTKTKHTPEIWTNPNNLNNWTSIPFTQLHQSKSLTIWTASIKHNNNSNHNYSFTYRLNLNNNIIWTGQLGRDGIIQSINNNNNNLNNNNNSLKNQLINAIHQQALHHDLTTQHSIDHHQFTLKNLENNPIPIQDHLSSSIQGLAFVRSKPTWFEPHPFIQLSEINPSLDTQLVIIHDPSEDAQQNLLILVPISSHSASSIIRSTPDSPLTICTTTTTTTTTTTATATSDPPTVKLMVINGPQSHLRHIINRHSLSLDHQPAPRAIHRHPKKLGYCTWNSLGPEYKLPDVLRVIESLKDSGLIDAVDRVLLDDGWQETKARMLSGWGTKKNWLDTPSDQTKQDSDLARAIDLIRIQSNQSIRHVGVWLTATGYWAGLDPDSETMAQFDLQSWAIRPAPHSDDPSTWTLPKRSSLRSFWESYFQYLKSAGVGFVKIDNQAGLDRLMYCESDPTESADVYKTTLLDVLDELVALYFGSPDEEAAINCMAHSPQIWFRDQHLAPASDHADAQRKKKIMRTSDDFFPDLADMDGHRWHILANAFNAIVSNGVGFIADFDMTMTKHPMSEYHAALRVFTDAPIFITDRHGQHDRGTHEKLTAPLKSAQAGAAVVQSMAGAGCVLSSCCLGQAAKDLSRPDSAWGLLKVGLAASYAGGGMLGVWNVKQNPSALAADVISARDLAETLFDPLPLPAAHRAPHNLVLFCDDHGHRRVHLVEDFDPKLELARPQAASPPVLGTVLEPNSFEIWRACRFFDLPAPHSSGSSNNAQLTVQVACLGVMNRFAGLCAVMTPTDEKTARAERPPSVGGSLNPATGGGSTGGAAAGARPPATTDAQDVRAGDGGGRRSNMLGDRADGKRPAAMTLGVRELVRWLVFWTWKSLKALVLGAFGPFARPAPGCTERTPLLGAADDGPAGLVFRTAYAAPVGFVVRIAAADQPVGLDTLAHTLGVRVDGAAHAPAVERLDTAPAASPRAAAFLLLVALAPTPHAPRPLSEIALCRVDL